MLLHHARRLCSEGFRRGLLPQRPVRSSRSCCASSTSRLPLLQSALNSRKLDNDIEIAQALESFSASYQNSEESDRREALLGLAQRFGVDLDEAKTHSSVYCKKADTSLEARLAAARSLRRALRPLYEDVFVHVNKRLDGLSILVDMRKDLLDLLRSYEGPHNSVLKAMNADLVNFLRLWIHSNSLELCRLTFDSPASLLHEISTREAVHAIGSVEELKKRLGPARRLFAFVHHRMPNQPLVFVNVALCNVFPPAISDVLSGEVQDINECEPTLALMYSVSLGHKGLSGIDLGGALLKNVVRALKKEFPSSLKRFATLSPIPNFRSWLKSKISHQDESLLTLEEGSTLMTLYPEARDHLHAFDTFLRDNRFKFVDESAAEAMKPVLLRLCTRYIMQERYRGKAFDPVARFHLGNGAIVDQIIWKGDVSVKGFRESVSLMASYDYTIADSSESSDYDDGVARIPNPK